jgi:hypothetical protein
MTTPRVFPLEPTPIHVSERSSMTCAPVSH